MGTANRIWLGSALGGLLLLACGGVTPESGPTGQAQRAATGATGGSATGWTRVLPWGSGVGQVRLRPRVTERMAEGPSAVAVAPDGAVLVLDRLNGRVLRVTGGSVRTLATVPVDSEDLAVGADGTLAAWSLLRSRVRLVDPAGAALGEVAVPRALRGALGISLGASHRVTLRVAHQETYGLGSPSAPLALPAVLHSKREGAWFLPDGQGLAVRRHPDGRAEVLVLRHGPRTRVTARRALPGPVMAARLVGVAGTVACLRLERRGPAAAGRISVDRRVLCLDVGSGALALDRALPLPPRSRYLPRRELAVGGDPARVAFLSPQPDGLHVALWPLVGGEVTP